jgi:hypothetical protein
VRPGALMIRGHRLEAVKPNVDNLQSNEVTKFPHIKKNSTKLGRLEQTEYPAEMIFRLVQLFSNITRCKQ